MVPKGFKKLQKVSIGSKRYQKVKYNRYQKVTNGTEWFQKVPKGTLESRIIVDPK